MKPFAQTLATSIVLVVLVFGAFATGLWIRVERTTFEDGARWANQSCFALVDRAMGFTDSLVEAP